MNDENRKASKQKQTKGDDSKVLEKTTAQVAKPVLAEIQTISGWCSVYSIIRKPKVIKITNIWNSRYLHVVMVSLFYQFFDKWRLKDKHIFSFNCPSEKWNYFLTSISVQQTFV